MSEAAAPARCPTNHDSLTIHRTNRRRPAHCNDCGAVLELPDMLALLMFWIEEDRRRMALIESSVLELGAAVAALGKRLPAGE